MPCNRWFLIMPVKAIEDNQTGVHSFLFKCIAGAPGLNLTMDPKVAAPVIETKNEKNNGDILLAYLAGMTMYKLQHPDDNDQAAIQLEGIRAVLKICDTNPDYLGRSKAASRYRELENSGKLDNWVMENLSR